MRAGGGDGSSGGWRLQYCLTVMDGVAKQLPSRGGLFAASPMGGIAVVLPTEMSYAVGCSLFKLAVLSGPGTGPSLQAAVPSIRRGFTLIKWRSALLPFFIVKCPYSSITAAVLEPGRGGVFRE